MPLGQKHERELRQEDQLRGGNGHEAATASPAGQPMPRAANAAGALRVPRKKSDHLAWKGNGDKGAPSKHNYKVKVKLNMNRFLWTPAGDWPATPLPLPVSGALTGQRPRPARPPARGRLGPESQEKLRGVTHRLPRPISKAGSDFTKVKKHGFRFAEQSIRIHSYANKSIPPTE